MTAEWAAALRSANVQALQQLLEGGADIDARDQHGQTALMTAARDGRAEVVRLLVGRRASLDHHAKYGLTALMLAVIGGHTEIARLLVEAGADVAIEGSGAPGFAGKTARDLALARGDPELIAVFGA